MTSIQSKEKTYAMVIAVFEIVLGTITIMFGLRFLEIYMVIWSNIQGPYIPGELQLVQGLLFFAGIFVIIHGIKRIVDSLLKAWVKS